MGQPRAISGNQGRVIVGGSTIAEVTGFQGTISYGVKTYVPQSGVVGGVGYQKTVQGNTKCSGTINGLLDPNYPPSTTLGKGALVTLVLYEQFPNAYINCTLARIDNRTFAADINSGDPAPFTAAFESDGQVIEVSI